MKRSYITVLTALALTGCGVAAKADTAKVSAGQSSSGAETSAVSSEEYDTFYGVLMDQCCSDIDEPAIHETNCMFMDGCRESGYGLDIEQPDGTWKFYMFDEAGQQQTWDYINTTQRPDGLYVTVTGTLENGTIKVISIKES